MDQLQNTSGIPQRSADPPGLNAGAPPPQNIPGGMMAPGSGNGKRRTGTILAIAAAIVVLAGGGIFYFFVKTRAVPAASPSPAPLTEGTKTPSLDDTLSQAGQKLGTDLALTFSGTATVAGPIVLEEEFNQDAIKIYGPAGASYLQGFNSGVDIRFSSVTGAGGKQLLDATSSFETETFFTTERLNPVNDPIVHYEGRRSITKLSSERNTEIQRAEGTATIRIPEGLKTKQFTLEELRQPGTATSTDPISAHLSDDGADSFVDVRTTGDLQNLIGVTMYDGNGTELPSSGYSKLDDGYSFSVDASQLAKLVVSYAAGITAKTYPFALEAASPAAISPASSTGTGGSPVSPNALDTPETRKAILAGMQRTYDVFASKDIQKIRSYASILGQADPQIKAQLASSSDKDLLMMVGFITLLPRPDDSYLTLGTWKIAENSASVTIKEKDGSTFTQDSKKIDGIWY